MTFTAAVVQAGSVVMDREACIEKAAELFEKISLTMPALDPGSLMPAQVADLVAHALSASEYPAGTVELAPDVEALKGITINAPE